MSAEATLGLGSLEDLMTASKGGVDPDPESECAAACSHMLHGDDILPC